MWLLPAQTDSPHRLAVFLDAELYLERVDAVSVIKQLRARKVIPDVTCVFVSNQSPAARHEDYLCNTAYSEFIAQDIVMWVAKQQTHLLAGTSVLCGLSLSGIAAAYAVAVHPGVFSGALCQSGSFWWLADHKIDLPRTNANFWLSVGDQETSTDVTHPPTDLHQRVSQIEGVRGAVERLKLLGGMVRYAEFRGGHDPGAWRAELPTALTWLFSADRRW